MARQSRFCLLKSEERGFKPSDQVWIDRARGVILALMVGFHKRSCFYDAIQMK